MALHDVPIPTSPAISYYFGMKFASQHGIKVLLDGRGSDENLRDIHLSLIG
jgi:asparagine synthetase B (glutamine-hydrolysing)